MTTRLAGLAGPLVHDVGRIVVRLEEEQLGMVQEARGPLLPDIVAVREVVHDSAAVQEHCVVIGPLGLVADSCAICLVVGSIKHFVDVRDEADLLRPVVGLHSKIRVGLVAGVASKASTESKGASIGDGVLVVVSVCVLRVDLPLQASATSSLVPSAHDVVESVDRNFEVRCWGVSGIGKIILERGHDSKRPEGLIIVALFCY